MPASLRTIACAVLLGFIAVALPGCVTRPKIDWDARVGNYTYDQTVLEMGPPDSSATLSDGTIVAQWLLFRGQSYSTHDYWSGSIVHIHNTSPGPNQYINLTFAPDGVLKEYKTVYK